MSRLGMGGMAELYKCRLTGVGGFDKFVAVKRILPDRSQEPELINMFMDEARLAANLSHPNIVQIYEIDEQEGLPYIVMEYVRGPTFRALYREAKKQNNLHLGHMAKIMADICSGLHYAHHATMSDGTPLKLVHRDVSPHNIMVTPGGVPKLLDFGVAKAEGRLSATNVGTIKGKLKYMPPEQLRGEAIDARADVFSAGVCLYEATTGGRLPFAASDAGELELLQAILKGVYTRPSEVVPDYPPALEKAILWAIDPDLSKRCGTAQELQEVLDQFATAPPHASSPGRIATWMTELFPHVDDPVPALKPPLGGQSVSRPSSPSRPSTASRTPGGAAAAAEAAPVEELSDDDFEVMPDPASRSRGAIWGAVAAGLLLVGGGAFWLGRHEPPSPLPPPAILAEAPGLSSDDVAAVAYMDEAERAGQQNRFGVALELLRKASTLKVTAPRVNIRLSTLTDDMEVQSLLFRARSALLEGKRDVARKLATEALARHPSNTDAMAVVASVNGDFVQDRPEAPAPPSVVDHRFPSAAPMPRAAVSLDGTLQINSQPAGGVVFMDDDMMGRTPLSLKTVRPGAHQLQVRLDGYRPFGKDVQVRAGRITEISAPLLRDDSQQPVQAGSSVTPGRLTASLTPPPQNPPGSTLVPSEPTPTSVTQAPPAPPVAPLAATPARPGMVSRPHLPSVYVFRDAGDLHRALAVVENEAMSQGRTGEMAHGVSRALADELLASGGKEGQIYPVAMYYFLVREAALGRSHEQAAAELKAVHVNRNLLKLRDLPHIETKL